MGIEDFFSPLGKSKRGKSKNVNGIALRTGRRGGGIVAFSHAKAKNTLQLMAKGARQAIVKKTNTRRVRSTTGKKLAEGAVNYVTRDGQLEYEDQNGNVGNVPKDVISDWWSSGRSLPESAKRWETINLVISTPAGTSGELLLDAARDFSKDNFNGHQYVMVMHHPDTDPDPEPSPYPHVHLIIKKLSYDGNRLWLSKADLHALRISWAEKLTERGLPTIATTRAQSLNPRRPQTQTQYHTGKSAGISNFSEAAITRVANLFADLKNEDPTLLVQLENFITQSPSTDPVYETGEMGPER